MGDKERKGEEADVQYQYGEDEVTESREKREGEKHR